MRTYSGFGPRTSSPALIPFLLAAAAASCDPAPGGAKAAGVSPKASATIEKCLLDLVAASTPLPAVAPAVDQSDWHLRRKETLERLRRGSRELGLAALTLYREKQQADPALQADLLDVAAHAAPAECADLLASLVTEYGPDLLVRRRAGELLGEVLPEKAIEVLEPILRGEVRGRTLPPEDTLLEAWFRAATALGRDRGPILCDVATDLRREATARYLATRLLGEAPSARGNAALVELATESNGDHLVRRYAVQALQRVLPGDEFCARVREISAREAEVNFQIFLQDVLDSACR
jgi:hypothetical protein